MNLLVIFKGIHMPIQPTKAQTTRGVMDRARGSSTTSSNMAHWHFAFGESSLPPSTVELPSTSAR
jgi:hypothetical protein